MKIGVCKECLKDTPVDCTTKVPGYEVYECDHCGYPNSLGDFWEVFETGPEA